MNVHDMPRRCAPNSPASSRDIERLETIFATWDETPQAAVRRLQARVEELNGEAIRRLIRALKADPAALAAMKNALADEVVYAVLRRHGSSSRASNERVETALDAVRPMLASHGGDVELVEVAPPAVEVRFTGACDGCPASALTFHAGVKKAVQDACPEITEIISGQGARRLRGAACVSSARSLWATRAAGVRGGLLSDIPEGAVRIRRSSAARGVLLSRKAPVVTCFQNACAHLGFPLDDGEIENGIITCPHHGFQYDLASGECLTAPEVQLQSHAVRVIGPRVEVRIVEIAMQRLVRPRSPSQKLCPGPATVMGRGRCWRPGERAWCLAATALRQRAGAIDRPGREHAVRPARRLPCGRRGPLFVCDTGHHRLLIWRDARRSRTIAPARFR